MRPKSSGVATPNPIMEPISSIQCPFIDSLPTFDWRNTKPLRLRPFSPKYHMTMALETTSPSDLIPMDSTYLDRIDLRKRLMKTDLEEIIQSGSTSAHPAIDELYSWLVGTYLPSRYPTMFRVISPSGDTEKAKGGLTIMRSLVTGEDYPMEPPSDPTEALKVLCALVDEDFLILLPAHDADGYTLGAFFVVGPMDFIYGRWLAGG
ncbi:MAG: hypothetical protein FRX48_08396 [Lasallia pustulata]|uniref:Uncharacterized protein n=1 Tax=Lasallia pustulata TaxID=136370 RepID=A0A5M8PFM8_9LECA|nr:MAG: hypothetical protein FRX48_08396 [Lasallia pustulata]